MDPGPLRDALTLAAGVVTGVAIAVRTAPNRPGPLGSESLIGPPSFVGRAMTVRVSPG